MRYILLLIIPVWSFAQKMPLDTIYGNIESVRERMIYLDSIQQGYKLFSSENEWGHYGFQGREFALQRNYTFWYELPWVQYVNYHKTYDKNGRILSEKWFSKDNRPLTEYKYQFDKKGNKVQEEIYNESGEKESVTRWGYDHENKLVSKISFSNDTIYFSFEGYTYDDDDNLVEEIAYNYQEKEHIFTHQYKNNLRVKSYYASKAYYVDTQHLAWKPLLRYEYLYDEKGNKVEIRDYVHASSDRGQNIPNITYYKYDDKNNLIKKAFDTTSISYIEYKYNKKNQLLEKKVFYKGNISEASQFKYDNSKILSLHFKTNEVDALIEFDYKIDIYGNWIEQTKSVNGKKLYIRRRDIKYRE